MDRSQQEEENKNQNPLVQYSNSLLFPSLGLSCPSQFLPTYSIDTCFILSQEVQSTIFQLETQMIPKKKTMEKILRISKRIQRKTKKNQNSKIIANPVLNEIRDLIIQVKSDTPFYRIKVVQKLKSVIENLENLLENIKHQLIDQLQDQESHIIIQ
ncbi:unnamed protein product (macronuclear) [Paramecium tetraurelia]|uniref:Uncharacterized protein n=1 Tax=Paramecium tetraurelia TaxID=5888 RepID=A0CNF7_PARTE|nr:uncharacterized protein GSPATT00008766001 [Paramecium tetraurelia]CAK72324.1 unnamed protein product [Paramecium tetraurelia]|eukprot:XP_001439721.1 hypothetical protein (macronuclear) [Paramecium tetraurelia strain d4-2]